MEAWRCRVFTAEAKKAESASEATLLTPRPPSLIGGVAWSHCVSVMSELVMRLSAECSKFSNIIIFFIYAQGTLFPRDLEISKL